MLHYITMVIHLFFASISDLFIEISDFAKIKCVFVMRTPNISWHVLKIFVMQTRNYTNENEMDIDDEKKRTTHFPQHGPAKTPFQFRLEKRWKIGQTESFVISQSNERIKYSFSSM